MAENISITVSESSSFKINAYPNGFAIIPTSGYSHFFNPEPDNNYAFSVSGNEVLNIQNAESSFGIGSFDISGAVNVTLGTLPYSTLASELDGFKYKFENFNLTTADQNSLSVGDVVYFKHIDSYNQYNCTVKKALTSDISKGAHSGLLIFLGYTGGNLFIMSKGYFDYEQNDNRLVNWESGKTIYLNDQSNIDVSPSTLSNYWVKSLGLCIPNNINKKRIWFDPDSTYLKIR
tara:strand:+ start:7900 stop:8598 length:699 start_codon:yes stop_codon:yes gene_type:complete